MFIPKFLKHSLCSCAFVLSSSIAHAATVINFDSLNAGDIVTGMTISGATFSVANQGTTGGDPRDLMIFDADCGGGPASNCSGGDSDLYFPGQGSVLIISEDNDSNDPDDTRFGGDVIIDFNPNVFDVVSIVLDVEDGPNATDNWVSAYLDGVLLQQIFVDSANNGSATADFGAIEMDQLQVHFYGSGAIQELNFTAVPVPAAAWLFGSALIGLAGSKRKK